MARHIGISRNSVRKYLALLDIAEELSNTELVDKAYNNNLLEHDTERLKQLSQYFSSSGSELSKTGVTFQLLWQEYLVLHPDGYSYSRYCYHLKQSLKKSDVSIHLKYQAG